MLKIWLEVSHHAAFRIGGWAFVRADGAGLTGQAGGERRVDAEQAALMALLAALEPAGLATVTTSSPLVLAIPARLAADPPPAGNLDLWARAKAALAAVRIVRAPANPFCASWADLARDRAKDKGAFTAAIPKSNLAKAGVR
jgi:hypothetical protein